MTLALIHCHPNNVLIVILRTSHSLSHQAGRFDRLGCFWFSSRLCCVNPREQIGPLTLIPVPEDESQVMSHVAWMLLVHLVLRCVAYNSTSTTMSPPRERSGTMWDLLYNFEVEES